MKKHIITFLVVAALAAAVTLTAFAGVVRSPGDEELAGELSGLTGMPRDLVLGLRDELGGWEAVTRDAFLHKRIYELKNALGLGDKWMTDEVARHGADALLAALDYAAREGYDRERLLAMLALADDGVSLSDLVAADALGEAESYKNYGPATEAEITAWMRGGYTAERILEADEAARAFDLTIAEALRKGLAAPETETGRQAEPPPEITVSGEDGSLTSYTAADWRKLEEKVRSELAPKGKSETPDGIDPSRWPDLGAFDFDNAARLAEETGADPAVVLDTRASGMEWRDIIALFRAAGSVAGQ